MTTTGFELGNDGPSTILVGVDGSTTSMRAAAWAGGLSRRSGAHLLAVCVVTPSGLASMSASTGVLYAESARQSAADLAAELERLAGSVGQAIEVLTLEGEAHEQLVRVADERRVDLVVVGASERAGHRLVGSLATRLVRSSRWPVTVVP